MEWIILDDGTDKVGDLFTSCPNVRYFAINTKLTIGAKRNRLNDLARGVIVVCMDDDDYYPPDRVAHAVASLQAHPDCKIAGASEMYLNFVDRKEVWLSGPFGPNHATNNTMAYWRSYADYHRYDEEVAHAEERSFTNDWTEPMVQLDPKSTVLMTCHANNTFDKRALLRNPASVMRLVPWPAV
jgi:glycosyltransferase involved in cell wall biosynthesis